MRIRTGCSDARMILAENNLIDWRQDQLQDPYISVILLGKEAGVQPT